MRARRIFLGILWIGIYLLLVCAPLLILLIGPRPAGREFWRDFSVALGYCGLSMMGMQFVLTARFKILKAPYGADIVYHFHRQISFVALALILSHPLLLFVFDPRHLELLNLFTAPWAARVGVSAVVALALIIGTSVWRKKLRLEYDRWRIWHGVLAVAAVAFATLHIELRAYYLTTLWKQIFWGLFGLFWIFVLAWVRIIKPLLLLRRPYEVQAVTPERGGAYTLRLKPRRHAGFNFHPGQFAWITAWDSPFSDHEHPFSFSGSPQPNGELAFTIKALGDFTGRVKDLQPGQPVYVDGPYGAFSIDRHAHAPGFVFIAGGIGITPFVSMLRAMQQRGDRRPVTLFYANKTLEGATFFEEIEQMVSKMPLKLVHVVEAPPEPWKGETGFVTADVLRRHLPDDLAANPREFFICGPAPMMNAVERALERLGIPAGDIHSERFDLV